MPWDVPSIWTTLDQGHMRTTRRLDDDLCLESTDVIVPGSSASFSRMTSVFHRKRNIGMDIRVSRDLEPPEPPDLQRSMLGITLQRSNQ